jgi:hypothetical protein
MNKLPLAKTLKRHELKETLGMVLIVSLVVLSLANPRLVLGTLNDVVLKIFGGF